MALNRDALQLVCKALRDSEAAGCESQTVLSLGYPDVLVDASTLEELLGAQLATRASYRPDSEAIARFHRMPEGTRIPEAQNLFALLGYDLEILDIGALRGGEMIHDLNEPVPERLHRRYALIIDPGTLEHCFNIAQAAANAAQMVAPGGGVLHANPLNMFNHGFYNLNPTWYHDFYVANGFRLEALHVVSAAGGKPARFDVPPTLRFTKAPPGSVLHCLARRVQDGPIVWPTQSKYASTLKA